MFGRNNKLDTEWLASVDFFDGFAKPEIQEVAALGERVDVEAGTELIDQGRVGDVCYVVVEGRAAVHIRGEFVTSVGAGTMVGEMALVEHRPRNATVTAETDMSLVSFGTEAFRKLLAKSPTAFDRVTNMLNDRLRENQERD
ncbi:MAG: Crp/Fnr family transcriptional regulator [Acidimicrobiales bacterium]